MSFMPVLVISLILLTITVLLSIADRLLVNYGQCKITVRQEDQSRDFTVQGGGFLLSELTSHGYNVPSSCAGKASCGYCKVIVSNGGGSILPTEEVFMSREEKSAGTRLSCQVKVKNDLDIFIPDFLSTVRTIVKNKTYDTKLKWKFVVDSRPAAIAEMAGSRISDEDEARVSAILDEFTDGRGVLVPILQRINATYNYLPEPVLRYTAMRLHKPISEVCRLASFYNAFSLEPKGRNVIRVCMGTSCYVKGGRRILETMQRKLGCGVGENTEDLMYTLETVSCIGCCGQSPVIAVNDDIYGYFRVDKIDDVLHKYYEESTQSQS